MKVKVEINITGVKPSEFRNDKNELVQFYHAYDDKGRRYGISEDTFNMIKSGKAPEGLSITCDDKGNWKLKGIDKDIIAV